MVIQLNGSDYELDGPCTVTELLARLGLEGKPVVVELDGRALLPGEFGISRVGEGSRVEIVSIVAGG